MVRVIGILSGKGGVGKTTLVSNLGLAFSKLGKKILVVDADLTGANLVQHFGIEPTATLNDVLEGRAFITEAFYKFSGIGIIPASILDYKGETAKLKNMLLNVTGDRDLILLDGPSGCGKGAEDIIQTCDELIIVTEPEMPSLTNSVGILKLAEKYERPVTGIIVNKFRNEKSTLKSREIEETLNKRLLGELKDHKHVRESIALRKPVISYLPNSNSSKNIMDTAYRILGQKPPERGVRAKLRNFFFKDF